MSKEIKDLKQGDEIYNISFREIKRYRYFCVHPNNSKYHILLNTNEEPIRMYHDNLESILSLNLDTHEKALRALVIFLEKDVEYIKKELKNE